MKSKLKLTFFATLLGLVVLAGVIYFVYGGTKTVEAVRVISYQPSICTTDTSASSCGPVYATVQTTDRQNTTYKVANHSDRNSNVFRGVSGELISALEEKTLVTLEINYKDEIVSVQ